MINETEAHRRDCLARFMLEKWPRDKIRKWLKEKPKEFREDMKNRLNKNDACNKESSTSFKCSVV